MPEYAFEGSPLIIPFVNTSITPSGEIAASISISNSNPYEMFLSGTKAFLPSCSPYVDIAVGSELDIAVTGKCGVAGLYVALSGTAYPFENIGNISVGVGFFNNGVSAEYSKEELIIMKNNMVDFLLDALEAEQRRALSRQDEFGNPYLY